MISIKTSKKKQNWILKFLKIILISIIYYRIYWITDILIQK